MLQTDQPKPIQGQISAQPPRTLCRMNPALLRMRARSAAFMLQNHRPKLIQGLMLDLAPSRALQDESCAPAHASTSTVPCRHFMRLLSFE